jgi:hypothetical protein
MVGERCMVWDRKNLYVMIDSATVRAHQQATTGHRKGVRINLWGVREKD